MRVQDNSVSIQLDDGEPVVVNLAPVAQAVENVFSNVPGLEELLAHLFPAAASGAPAAPASQGVPETLPLLPLIHMIHGSHTVKRPV